MRNMMVMLLLVFLTGCVSYYYPETALEDGVYYAEDDPAYVLNSGDYSGVVYYPWLSVDYFYLGYDRCSYPYTWGYASCGHRYGYYDFHSMWFPPYRGHYYRQARHENCSQQGDCDWNNGDTLDDVDARIAREDRENRRNRDGSVDENEGPDPTSERRFARNRYALVVPYAPVMPIVRAGAQDKVIRNNYRTDFAGSRTNRGKPVSAQTVSVPPSTSVAPTQRSAPSSRTYSGRSSRSAPVSSRPARRASGYTQPSSRKEND